MTRVLIVGTGLVGAATRAALERGGVAVVAMSRSTGLHLETREGLVKLHDTIASILPDAVVLAHGPTSPEWCHTHPAASLAIHAESAGVVAESGARIVLVSSDVVFDGVATVFHVDDRPRPVTSYGRAKLEAERRLIGVHDARIVRVAMVYGNSRPGNSFAERVLHALAVGRAVEAPIDQFISPVYVEDVAEVVAAAALSADAPRLLHLGGPMRMSRYQFASEAARQLGASLDLVRPVKRAGTIWELRPKHSSLATSWAPPGLLRRGLVHPPEGLRMTIERISAVAGRS